MFLVWYVGGSWELLRVLVNLDVELKGLRRVVGVGEVKGFIGFKNDGCGVFKGFWFKLLNRYIF